jgi:hypothetical protein
MRARIVVGLAVLLAMLVARPPAARSQAAPGEAEAPGRTPPRLAFIDGQVSFWRPGAQEWAQAQVNTPLAPGDELYTGSPGNLELQIGSRAFVRAWASTQLGLANEEPDYLQIKVTTGHASLDVRTLDPGRTVEVDTPHAAFTIEHPGYYRVDVTGERTSFITRRGGRARVTSASGATVAITPSEELVVEGTTAPRVASYVAPPLDDWDRWNYARTDGLLEAVSARYVSAGVYGASDLDRYGTWRVVPTYGSVWVPAAVPAGWAPYTTGSWVLDPHYGWTWVDTAPWGWAPYHHGRWVYLDGIWAWTPGAIVARAVYAPALVAFLGEPGVRVGGPVGWVALGWGEPIVPWWGPVGHIHVASWAGWGGPRIVNNVVIERTTIVHTQNITVYRNAGVRHAVVVVREEHFGRGPVAARATHVDVVKLHPVHTAPRIAAAPASFVPTARRGAQPPPEPLARSVVATRAPRAWSEPAATEGRRAQPSVIPTPAPRLVTPPQREPAPVPSRPPFGESKKERAAVERQQKPTAPPKPQSQRGSGGGAEGHVPAGRPAPVPSRPETSVAPPAPAGPQVPSRATPAPAAPDVSRGASRGTVPAPRTTAPSPRQLPGEPANRLFPGRGQAGPASPTPASSGAAPTRAPTSR